jgi:anti-sigma regulatory factor (Ser/Thr protein kinase)
MEALRDRCRRQELTIRTLGDAVSTFKRGTEALRSENADLRAENVRLTGADRRTPPRGNSSQRGALAEATIPLGVDAPAAARTVVERCLGERVAPSVLDVVRLLVTELVTNSVRHSGVPEGEDLVVRVQLWGDRCRLEVEDPGCDGTIAPWPAGSASGSGMGLNLVRLLSERWGVVRASDGPTRVWAQLPRSHPLA